MAALRERPFVGGRLHDAARAPDGLPAHHRRADPVELPAHRARTADPQGISVIREWIASGFTIPPAISEIPGIGPWLHDQLLFAIDPAPLSTTMQKLLEPLSAALLNAAVNVSNILLQLALVTFIVFFFYRDGAWFADRVQA